MALSRLYKPLAAERYVTMIRPGLTAMVAFSALVGYVAAAQSLDWRLVLALPLGIALLSAAASILNQFQERTHDALMARTDGRPLACGRVAAGDALLLACGCALSGALLLAAIDLPVLATGLAAMLFYNALYTPLKRISSFALLPGAVSGALPVAAGWLAAESPWSERQLVLMVIFMVLWQVPHFICLAIRERDEYRRAGFKLVPESVTAEQMLALTCLWSVALAVAGMLLVAAGLLAMPYSVGAVALIGWLLAGFLRMWRAESPVVFATAYGGRLKLFLGFYLGLILIDGMKLVG